MVDKNILLKKISQIRHNLSRLKEKENIQLDQFKNDQDIQDIILHNLQLAVQGCIDVGSHIISDNGWGVAGSLNEIFYILQTKGVMKNNESVKKLVSMVGFRNILVHEYEKVNLDIVYNIFKNRLTDIDNYLISIIDYYKL